MLRNFSFTFVVTLLLLNLSRGTHAEERNLLIIQTDEHHFNTLGCYGGSIVETPNIDWIANNGAKCNRFYATTPVCSPSRAALVSGLYPQKTPVVTNNIPLDDSVVTFAELLRREGYATGFAGKWHLDGDGKPQWAPKRQFGFADNRFMFNRGHWKKFVDTPNGPRVGARNNKGQPGYGVAGADEKTFSTDWLSNKAIDFIQKNKAKPFCYFVSLPDPHGPNTVRAPYDTMYSHVNVKLPKTFKRDAKQIPAWGKPAGVKAANLKKLMIQYYGMVKCIDDNIGRILNVLRETGTLKNTVIVFTSDHGDLCGQHGRLNKGVPYEGSARIPFLMYCDGKIAPGTVVNQALTCVDFLPTVLPLLGHEVTIPVDGRNAGPLFTSKNAEWNDVAFVRSTPGSVWLSAVSQQYKLVYSAGEIPWLLDLENDPAELNNLYGDTKYDSVIASMTRALDEYVRTHKDEHGSLPRIRRWMDEGMQRGQNGK